MNSRRVWTWLVFWAGVCIVIAALSWASVSVYNLEARNAETRAMAQRQELIQRALWRIDSRIAPIIALEASRPYADYDQFETTDHPWVGLVGGRAGVAMPESNESFVHQYFQYADSAESEVKLGFVSPSVLMEKSLHGVDSERLDDAVDGAMGEKENVLFKAQETTAYDYQARKQIADLASQNVEQQRSSRARPKSEYLGVPPEELPASPPAESIEVSADSLADSGIDESSDLMLSNAAGATVGALMPRWITDDSGEQQLVLIRRVSVGGRSLLQGVHLDWAEMNAELTASVADIMPASSIVPSTAAIPGKSYPLATIPAAFIPGGSVGVAPDGLTPALLAMLVAWIAVLATIATIGFVLREAIGLSDRRGRFVTAVTHELRTPLTTFRLYSQMLADGMVRDDEVRAQYLNTLKRESERLTGIVENVLEYARLSRTRSPKSKPAGVQTLSPDALLVRIRPELSRRAEQSGMDLIASIDLGGHGSSSLTVDPHAVERIMMNLVENACKYAGPPDGLSPDEAEIFDTRIHLDASIHDGRLELLVADHGPGIEPDERAKIFGEFQRGSRRRIQDRSGLGLGLALSRGLAREMGGELGLVARRGHGAEFLLTIPLDDPLPPAGNADPR